MTFEESCRELDRLCDESLGHPIELANGECMAFTRLRRYSSVDIHSFEREWNISLPESYQSFLRWCGAARCYSDRFGFVEFMPLENIQGFMNEVFLTRVNPFPELLLITAFTGGEEAGFSMSRTDNQNFALFDPEVSCDEWLETAFFWTSFERWLPVFVGSHGHQLFPPKSER